MRYIRELITLAKSAHPRDSFFANFEQTMRAFPDARAQYLAYERALSALDVESWAVLCEKAVAHFTDHRKGQRKQGFFNQLNDAFAYKHLVRRGYGKVRVLREVGKTQPDIEYVDGRSRRYCEVKTIGISDDLIARRDEVRAHSSRIYYDLSPQFLNKLRSTVEAADQQVKARGASGLIYLVVHFDDFTLEHYKTYRKQIVACLEAQPVADVYVQIGLLGRKRIAKGSARAGRPLTHHSSGPAQKAAQACEFKRWAT